MRLEGEVAVISGTARGMGRAAALHFAREGAIVAGGDLLEDEALETLELIESAGGTGSCARLDVTDQRRLHHRRQPRHRPRLVLGPAGIPGRHARARIDSESHREDT
jgi:NAD(P)-dependent dehydrogenase (short-subunit alcohol dehydrogenase family)